MSYQLHNSRGVQNLKFYCQIIKFLSPNTDHQTHKHCSHWTKNTSPSPIVISPNCSKHNDHTATTMYPKHITVSFFLRQSISYHFPSGDHASLIQGAHPLFIGDDNAASAMDMCRDSKAGGALDKGVISTRGLITMTTMMDTILCPGFSAKRNYRMCCIIEGVTVGW